MVHVHVGIHVGKLRIAAHLYNKIVPPTSLVDLVPNPLSSFPAFVPIPLAHTVGGIRIVPIAKVLKAAVFLEEVQTMLIRLLDKKPLNP